MELGKFSISLVVKDIEASRAFYEALGFKIIDGQFNHQDTYVLNDDQDWLMMGHGNILIGLFQGMFDRNVLTFHPPDVRAVQTHLKTQGIPLTSEVGESGGGSTAVMLEDPDGNPILMDQPA